MTEKNKSFMFGIAVGVAVIAVVGWIITAVNANKGSTTGVSSSNQRVVNNNAGSNNSGELNSGNTNLVVTDSDYIRGNPDAPVTIIEFSDFQCPYCARHHNTMKQVMAAYPDQVRWVYKHFPLDSIHSNARPAAEASECAAEQGKFWDFADAMFANQSSLGTAMFKETAKNLGLNTNQFNNCVDSRKYKDKVEVDYQLGVSNDVRGTPGNFINGQSVPGAVPFEQIKSVIDGLL